MDPMLAMIMPKGIVVNTGNIYDEVASYPVVPPEKIFEYWHVYTTTFRKLIDPTAHRLENFWWHVWGSDRRHLSGRALAKLYEEISKGPPLFPIHWEDPPFLRRARNERKDAAVSVEQNDTSRESSPTKRINDSAPKPSPTLLSSSSKPPPPHPILKKSRGPSTSGPRPTARFVSPHDTEDEDTKDNDEATSTTTASVDNKPAAPAAVSASPAKSSGKKSAPVTKKFVASSPASKRRPALGRRPSSQSSVGSDAGSREGSVTSGSRYLMASQRLVPSIAEQTKESHTSRSQEKATSSAQPRREALSAKAAGKRPAGPPSPDLRQQTNPAQSAPASQAQPGHNQHRPVVVQTAEARSQPKASEDTKPSQDAETEPPLYEVNRARGETQRATQSSIGARRGSTLAPHPNRSTAAPTMTRSRSYHEHVRPRELSIGRAPPQGLLSGATAGTTTFAAQGSLIGTNDELITLPAEGVKASRDAEQVEAGSLPASGFLRRGLDGDLTSRPSSSSLLGDLREPQATVLPSRPSTSSLLESRFAPTQPSTSAVVPLGRSKSQLTLLLEREKARGGDKPRFKAEPR